MSKERNPTYERVRIEDERIVPEFTTTISPRPPFYLFVPSIDEIPANYLKKMRGKAFALGDFFDSDEEALMEVKKNGYKGKDIDILREQGYLVFKDELEEIIDELGEEE